MIGHTGLLEYHPCPLGAFCSRVYCPFMHDQAIQGRQSSQSSNNVVIRQEDENFQGGGYVGYIGTVDSYNANNIPSTSYRQPMYAQQPTSSTTYDQQPIYQQPIVGAQYGQWRPSNQYDAYQPVDHQRYGQSNLQSQVSLYAPKNPATFSSASAGLPMPAKNSVCSQVMVQSGIAGRQGTFTSSMHRQQPAKPSGMPFSSHASNVPKQKGVSGKFKKERVREQFPPLTDAVAINPKKVQNCVVKTQYPEESNIVKHSSIKPQKRKIAEEVQQYQNKLDRQIPEFEKAGREDKQAIDDILSTASHVSVPLSSKPPSKKKPPLKRRPSVTVSKPENLRKSISSDPPPAKHIVPAKEGVRKQVSAKDTDLSRNAKGDSKFVLETKAAPASALALRVKQQKDGLQRSNSSSRESSVEFVPCPSDVTIDLNSDDKTRENLDAKKNTQFMAIPHVEASQPKVNAAKIKGKPEVLNANIKAITKIDEEIEKLGKDLLSKETKKTPVWRQETIKKWKTADSKTKNLPMPSSGALHNPNFDINSLFDDDEASEPAKASKESNVFVATSQGPPRKNSAGSTVVPKPQSSMKSHSSVSVPKRMPPAAETMANRFSPSASSSMSGSGKVYQMINKGGARTARPAPSTDPGKTFAPLDPHNKKLSYGMRYKYLVKLRDEILNSGGCTEDEAAEKAIRQEKEILDRVSSKIGYGGAIATAIKQIRECLAGPATHSTEAISHSGVLAGRHAKNISMAIKRSKRDDKSHISEADFYVALRDRYLMTKEQLYENGFPIWVDDSTKRLVAIKPSDDSARRQRYVADENLKRNCSRCGFEYRLTKDGAYATETECVYHWGKPWKKRYNGTVDARYTCCDQDLTIKGCTVMNRHITDTLRQSTLNQYVETPKPVGPGDPRSNKVYAMDCEMVYGVWGTQIARISVVDLLDELVLDEFVRPEDNNPIVDCNTRFSGLTEEHVKNAKYDLRGVQLRLFELVNSETILVGHSLESDLKALRIVHSKVVDTSVVFPHRLGPPKKRALKTLTSEFLQKIIQEEESGHDSKEDASACIMLMKQKLKSDG